MLQTPTDDDPLRVSWQETLWSQPDFVLKAAELHPCALQHADENLRRNRAFILSAFERNPECVCGLVATDIRRVWQSYEGLEHPQCNGKIIREWIVFHGKAECIDPTCFITFWLAVCYDDQMNRAHVIISWGFVASGLSLTRYAIVSWCYNVWRVLAQIPTRMTTLCIHSLGQESCSRLPLGGEGYFGRIHMPNHFLLQQMVHVDVSESFA